jgi:hypothetical protein
MTLHPANASQRAQVHASLINGLRLLAELSPKGVVVEDDGFVLVSTGVPDADLNCAYVSRRPDTPVATLQRVRDFFAARSVPWRLFTWEDLATALAPLLEQTGFRRAQTEPGMVLAPLPALTPPLPAGLSVVTVGDSAMLGRWRDVLAAVFNIPRDGAELLLSPRVFGHPRVTVLLGWAEDEPVAIGMGLTSERLVNVNAIGTLAAFRRRGYGEALTWRAALSGPKECAGACLNASVFGFPVYTQMGFRHVIDYERWAVVDAG